MDHYTEESEDRLFEMLQDMMDNPGYLRGISTGFDTIDRATRGMQPEQLITLVGIPKAGKSSIALAIARAARRMAKNTVFFTFEMTVEEQQYRLLSMDTGMSLTNLLTGKFNPAKLKAMRRDMKVLRDGSSLMFMTDTSATTTLDAVAARILQMSPDLVIIDGAYLLDPDDSKVIPMSPQHLTKMTRGAKRMAQRLRLPIVITTQALIARSKKGLDMGSVGYSSSFAQDSDVLLGVESVLEDSPKGAISKVKVLASRSGPKGEAFVRVDWSSGTIEEIDKIEAGRATGGRHDSTHEGWGEGDYGDDEPRHRRDPGGSRRRRRVDPS